MLQKHERQQLEKLRDNQREHEILRISEPTSYVDYTRHFNDA
jgi:hypothetical protein